MVAPLVLLNRAFAFRTVLSVCHDPRDVLALVRVLRLPLRCHLARTRPMRLLRAFETERVAALALYVTNPVFLILHAVVAALERAPSHVLVVIRE